MVLIAVLNAARVEGGFFFSFLVFCLNQFIDSRLICWNESMLLFIQPVLVKEVIPFPAKNKTQ